MPRIGLVGGECTGKSSLAQELAGRWGGTVVDEEVRRFVQEHGRPPHRSEQGGILRAQQAREDATARTHSLVIADPAAAMTAIYSIVYFDDDSLLPPALDRAADYDLVVWCAPDIPWQADPGMRDGVGMRDRAESAIAEQLAPALHERGVRVVRVTGALADRVDAVGQAWQPGAPQPPT